MPGQSHAAAQYVGCGIGSSQTLIATQRIEAGGVPGATTGGKHDRCHAFTKATPMPNIGSGIMRPAAPFLGFPVIGRLPQPHHGGYQDEIGDTEKPLLRFAFLQLGLALMATMSPAGAEVRLRSQQQWPGDRNGHVSVPKSGVAVRLAGRVENATIGPVTIAGAHQAVWTESDETVIRNLDIRQITIKDAGREGIRIRGDADGVRIRDFDIRMRQLPQTGKALPTGIAIYGGRNIVIGRGSVGGFRMQRIEKRYTNGDGIASESKVDGLTITDVTSSGNSDGGFDLKGRNIRLDRLTAKNNGRNYRFWGNVHAGALTSIDARANAIGIKGNAAHPPVIEIERLVVRQDRPIALILVEGGPADIRIGACDIQAPPRTRLLVMKGGGKTALGPGCKLR